MSKQNIALIALLTVAIIFFINLEDFDIKKLSTPKHNTDIGATSLFHLPSIDLPSTEEAPVSEQAWSVFQKYLEYAKTHDLQGVMSLSHQISEVCNNPERKIECYALMDNVYEVASPLQASEFKHVQADNRQIIMSTDGPVVAILYFTRDQSGSPKMLGIGFCLEDNSTQGKCVDPEQVKIDENKNGWWDVIEALFK